MSAKLILLVVILVAGVVSHQYKELTSPCIEEVKNDSQKY